MTLTVQFVISTLSALTHELHPDIYLKSIAKPGLKPEEACMVAAHQIDPHYAAGHCMQTAFVIGRDEFGGNIKPPNSEAGTLKYIDHAEIPAGGEWTCVADSIIELAEMVVKEQSS